MGLGLTGFASLHGLKLSLKRHCSERPVLRSCFVLSLLESEVCSTFLSFPPTVGATAFLRPRRAGRAGASPPPETSPPPRARSTITTTTTHVAAPLREKRTPASAPASSSKSQSSPSFSSWPSGTSPARRLFHTRVPYLVSKRRNQPTWSGARSSGFCCHSSVHPRVSR